MAVSFFGVQLPVFVSAEVAFEVEIGLVDSGGLVAAGLAVDDACGRGVVCGVCGVRGATGGVACCGGAGSAFGGVGVPPHYLV